ncbi:MAG: hypothetical protein ACLFR1_05330, partial [Spirochaetia bacterium]
MLETVFLYLRNSLVTLLLVLCAPFFFSSCEHPDIWGVDPEEFSFRIENQNTEFLRHLDYSTYNVRDILRLDAAAPFYLSFYFNELGLIDIEIQLLELAFQETEEILRHSSGLLLLERLIQQERFEQALAFSAELRQEYPEDEVVFLHQGEAFFGLSEWEEVISVWHEYVENAGSLYHGNIISELQGLAIRAGARTEQGTDFDSLRLACLNYPASDVHEEIYSDFTENGFFSLLPAGTGALLQFKAEIASQEYGRAKEALNAFFTESAWQAFFSPWIINEIGRAYIGTGTQSEGARQLLWYAEAGDREHSFYLLERAGRLFRSAGRYSEAVQALESAYEIAPYAAAQDRCLWYLLDSLVSISFEQSVSEIVAYSRFWHNPYMFSDVIARTTALLTGSAQWELLWEFYQGIEGTASRDALYP